MDKLKVTASLSGPLITGGGYLTLDALLASAVYSLTQDIDQAHNHLPLHRAGKLYYASAGIYEPLDQGKHTIVQGFRPDDLWLDHKLLKKNKHGRVHVKFSVLPSNILNTYKSITTPSIT